MSVFLEEEDRFGDPAGRQASLLSTNQKE